MANNASNSKADTAVKLVLVFFISLLSFSVGTYVGKQVSDSDARQAALEADYHGAEKVAAHTEEAAGNDEATAPISDEEVSSLTDEFVKSEQRTVASEKEEHAAEASHEDTHAESANAGFQHHSKIKANEHEAAAEANNEAKHAKPEHKAESTAKTEKAASENTKSTHTASSGSPELSHAADRVAHDKSPTADAKNVRKPSGVLPTVATTAIGKYTVQVASYATENEAKAQATKLTSKGYSAFFIPATVNGKTWFRVSIGLFSDMKSARNYRTELLSTQAVSSAIVQKIVK